MNSHIQIIREEPLERAGWHRNAKEVLSVDGLCRTISTQSNNLATKIKEKETMRIRKLTPKECWRLMGFEDGEVNFAGQSYTQLSKRAANGWDVNVVGILLNHIWRQLL